MLNPKQIDDLVKTTQDLLIKQGAFVDLMSDLTDYVAVNKLFKNHKKVFDGGLDWKFDAIVDHNHSAKFTGLYANDGAALNDATIDGIRIEDTTFATLMNHRLQNGEFIPTLQQYLHEATRWPLCRLILEVKPHRNAKRDASISELAVELVETMGLASRTDYISFSKDACKRLHELAPEAKVAYLNGDLTPLQVKEMGLTGIDYSAATFDKHPEWPLEAKKLGLEVNVWTVDGEEELRRFGAMKGIDIITTNDPDILIKTLGNKK
jgi:glycerophosphoryl diester phosphodiesterase